MSRRHVAALGLAAALSLVAANPTLVGASAPCGTALDVRPADTAVDPSDGVVAREHLPDAEREAFDSAVVGERVPACGGPAASLLSHYGWVTANGTDYRVAESALGRDGGSWGAPAAVQALAGVAAIALTVFGALGCSRS